SRCAVAIALFTGPDLGAPALRSCCRGWRLSAASSKIPLLCQYLGAISSVSRGDLVPFRRAGSRSSTAASRRTTQYGVYRLPRKARGLSASNQAVAIPTRPNPLEPVRSCAGRGAPARTGGCNMEDSHCHGVLGRRSRYFRQWLHRQRSIRLGRELGQKL